MLFIGLGNPGEKYAMTHHNVGFMAADSLAASFNATFQVEKKFQCYLATFSLNGVKHYIMKPTTYMNLSGMAVRAFINYYKLSVDDIFVMYDDMDLPVGTFKIRKTGSSGGHNGIKSIINEIKSDQFKRLRIGIGRKKDATSDEVIDYVLSPISLNDRTKLDVIFSHIPNIVIDLINHGMDYIMNNYNGKSLN